MAAVNLGDLSFGKKFGKLTLKNEITIKFSGNTILSWVCDCGRDTTSTVCRVLSGETKTCGKCNFMPASFWGGRKYSCLQMKKPGDYHLKSGKKVEWLCDCGRTSIVPIIRVVRGYNKSCGHCGTIVASEMSSRKFGRLRMTYPADILPFSEKKVQWSCDCGRTVEKSVHDVVHGHTSRCGSCNNVDAPVVNGMKFGRLRMKVPRTISKGSGEKVLWACDCGGEAEIPVNSVFSGKTKSCGQCRVRIRKWYLHNREQIVGLSCPVSPEQFPAGGPVLMEDIGNSREPFNAVCPVCGSVYKPALHNVKRGVSITCGCHNGRKSSPCLEISDFLTSIGVVHTLEHEVGGRKYDLFIPSEKTLLEMNGLYWHSMDHSRSRDLSKYEVAISLGFSYICLFEDEWKKKRPIFENVLKNRFKISDPVSVRPSECRISIVPGLEADDFYSRNHYIGPCRPKISYGVYINDTMISCCSFSKPTRQSKHEWELVRAASAPTHRVHGIWSKLLSTFISDFSPKSVVTFSDNRLFGGNLYQTLGFVHSGDVPPDYYWVKGGRRFHKSGLRKTLSERSSGLTEAQLREAEGYRKIWDIGKKRWILNVLDTICQ